MNCSDLIVSLYTFYCHDCAKTKFIAITLSSGDLQCITWFRNKIYEIEPTFVESDKAEWIVSAERNNNLKIQCYVLTEK